MPIDIEATSARLKQLCKEKGITASDLQKFFYLDNLQAISKWFAGEAFQVPIICWKYLTCLLPIFLTFLW